MGRRAVIGEWYLSHETHEQFEVVALDDLTGTIDIQYFDGNIDEFDLEIWDQMDVDPCAPPEDAQRGAFEMEFDGIDDTDESATAEDDEYALDDLTIFHTEKHEKHSAF